MTVFFRVLLAVFLILAPAAAQRSTQGDQTSSRTVGPQRDGSIVVSDNQTLTPAGKIVDLGSPVRAKAIALNPNGKTNERRRPAHGLAPADYRVRHRHRAGSAALHSNYGERHGLYFRQDRILHRHHLFRRRHKAVLQPGRQSRCHRECESGHGLSDQRAERGPAPAAGGWPALL
jgi:hypothetical protein